MFTMNPLQLITICLSTVYPLLYEKIQCFFIRVKSKKNSPPPIYGFEQKTKAQHNAIINAYNKQKKHINQLVSKFSRILVLSHEN